MNQKREYGSDTVGVKIKKARLDKKITLEQMANETGLSINLIKSIESGDKQPSVSQILQISKALEIDSSLLLKDSNLEKAMYKIFKERTENYAYETLTPGAEKKHLRAFRISIEAMQEHKGISYQHEGEEFIYVLKGHVEVTVGENVNTLHWGESLHFNSGINHKIKNISSTVVELIVVLFTP